MKPGYRTDGSSHHNGVKNEHATVGHLNSNPDSNIRKFFEETNGSKDIRFVHKGGTRTKTDMQVVHEDNLFEGKVIEESKVLANISVKNHKSGTFDLHNGGWKDFPLSRSHPAHRLTRSSQQKNVKEEIAKVKEEGLRGAKNKTAVLFCSLLDDQNAFDSDFIRNFIKKIFDVYPEYIHINLCKKKKYVLMNKFDTDLFKLTNDEDVKFFLLKPSRGAKTSRQIAFQNGDNVVLTGLRLRLQLNNGISALFTRGSSPCIKLQLDKVDKFIENAHKIIETY